MNQPKVPALCSFYQQAASCSLRSNCCRFYLFSDSDLVRLITIICAPSDGQPLDDSIERRQQRQRDLGGTGRHDLQT